MCENMDKTWIADERGHSLFELSLSLPMIVMLTLSLGSLFLWTLRFFLYEMADWTLQKDLCRAMERIVYDARAADTVIIEQERFGTAELPFSSISLRKPRCYPETKKNWDFYMARIPQNASGAQRKIYRSSDYEPITGDNIFCNTALKKFRCELVAPARLRIEIQGWAPLTRHVIEVKTEIFLPEMMKNATATPTVTGN